MKKGSDKVKDDPTMRMRALTILSCVVAEGGVSKGLLVEILYDKLTHNTIMELFVTKSDLMRILDNLNVENNLLDSGLIRLHEDGYSVSIEGVLYGWGAYFSQAMDREVPVNDFVPTLIELSERLFGYSEEDLTNNHFYTPAEVIGVMREIKLLISQKQKLH